MYKVSIYNSSGNAGMPYKFATKTRAVEFITKHNELHPSFTCVLYKKVNGEWERVLI